MECIIECITIYYYYNHYSTQCALQPFRYMWVRDKVISEPGPSFSNIVYEEICM